MEPARVNKKYVQTCKGSTDMGIKREGIILFRIPDYPTFKKKSSNLWDYQNLHS